MGFNKAQLEAILHYIRHREVLPALPKLYVERIQAIEGKGKQI